MKYKDHAGREIILDKEETQMLKDFEAGKFVPVANEKEEIARYTQMFRENKKNRAVSLRIADTDLKIIKERAEDAGMPYQTLIGTLLHQFAQKKIQLEI